MIIYASHTEGLPLWTQAALPLLILMVKERVSFPSLGVLAVLASFRSAHQAAVVIGVTCTPDAGIIWIAGLGYFPQGGHAALA